MKQHVKRVNTRLFFAFVFFVLALLIPVCAYLGVLIPDGEPHKIWFQRSGSLVTLFSVLAEIMMFVIPDIIYNDGNNSDSAPFDDDTIQECLYKAFKYVGFLLIISGTLIWGYGDLIVDAIT